MTIRGIPDRPHWRTELTFSIKRFGLGVFCNFRDPIHETWLSIAVGPVAFKIIRWRGYR